MSPATGSEGSVVITGASTGIGKACALRLAQRGFRVFAGVRQRQDGAALQQEGPAGAIIPLELDVTEPAHIAAAAKEIAAAVGDDGLAGLVNNAGIGVGGPLEFLELDELRRQFEVNVVGVVAVTQPLVELLRRRRGRIVNISSLAGHIGQPFVGPYCASKHALEALSDAMRLELRPWGIQVSLVEPGAIATPIWDKAEVGFAEARSLLTGRAGELYGAAVAAMEKSMLYIGRAGISPEAVAEVVEHALTARRAKIRYPVGKDAKTALLARWLLPDRTIDKLVAKQLRIP